MNGDALFLDTNAFIYFFEGRSKITQLVVQTPVIYFSVISEIELLSATWLSVPQIDQIKAFLALCQRVELSSQVIDQTITIRRDYRFRIPDAIIVSSALALETPLVSADTDFQKISQLTLISEILD